MTPEEVDRTIEFILKQSAQFSVHMEQVSERMDRVSMEMEGLTIGLKDLRESTARFQEWASEVVVIQSRRLDESERFHRDTSLRNERFQEQALDLLHRILDKLEPPQKN